MATRASGAATVELGYFLTGETRGYKGGKWDRTKVLKPWNEGGWGALQINGRVDYLDSIRSEDRVQQQLGLAWPGSPFYVNGGKQLGLSGERDLEPGRLDALLWLSTATSWLPAGRVRPDLGRLTEPATQARVTAPTSAAIRAQIEF